jgi:hypothetical protein
MATASMRGLLHAFQAASVAPIATQRMWIGTAGESAALTVDVSAALLTGPLLLPTVAN